MSKVSVELAHDSNRIQLITANDIVELDESAVKELSDSLITLVKQSRKRVPPAPPPVTYDSLGVGGEKVDFLCCGAGRESQGFSGYIYVAGYEITTEGAKTIKKWLESAIKYLEG